MHTDIDVPAVVDVLLRRFQEVGEADRAPQMKAYLKSDLQFLGAPTAATRGVVQAFLREQRELTREAALAIAEALWATNTWECRSGAVMLLSRHARTFQPGDVQSIERLLRTSHTWALVDGIATDVVAKMLAEHPGLEATLDRWAEDEDFWIRRTSMLALLPELRAGRGDWQRFAGYADSMLDEREFFIRKAIGWVLREVSKKRPDLVDEWLLPRASRASGVTVREAVKYLPEVRRDEIMAAHRGRDGPLTSA